MVLAILLELYLRSLWLAKIFAHADIFSWIMGMHVKNIQMIGSSLNFSLLYYTGV